MSRLKDLYNEQIVDAMTKKFGYKNVMEVPKLSKIVINMGVGESVIWKLSPDRKQLPPKRKIP